MMTLLDSLIEAGVLAPGNGQVNLADTWLSEYLQVSSAEPAEGHFAGERSDKLTIGLTGNIATGKSAVLRILESLGAAVIDADRVVHELREPGAAGYEVIASRFGSRFMQPDGSLDLARLGQEAFSNQRLMRELEDIFRPLVVAEIQRRMQRLEEPVIVIEAIKLLDGPLKHAVDQVWVVDAPRELRIRRLVEARGLDPADAQRRVDAQSPQALKLAEADLVINNTGSLADLRSAVLRSWRNVLRTLSETGKLSDDLIARWLLAWLPEQEQSQVDRGELVRALRAIASGRCNRETAEALLEAARAG